MGVAARLDMLTKKLGLVGPDVPAIALGMSGLGRLSAEALKQKTQLMSEAIDSGLNFLDTADLYAGGLSEQVVGQLSKNRRSRVFIASKFYISDNNFEIIENKLDASLKRLQTDYLDLYQIHWPHPDVDYIGVCEKLEYLRKQGKIRFFGLSNFQLGQILPLKSYLEKGLVSSQLAYNLLDRAQEQALFNGLNKLGLTCLAYSPLNQGHISCCSEAAVLLDDIAARYSTTPAAVVLNWLISKPGLIAVTKCSSSEHIKDMHWALLHSLERSELESIEQHALHTPKMLSLASIDIERAGTQIYQTAEESAQNNLELIPSPNELAQMIKMQAYQIHLRVRKLISTSGLERYELDAYDLNDQNKKYWAYCLAYPEALEIAALELI